MTIEQATQTQSILLEPEGLLVPLGSRIAYMFGQQSERTRFAEFIRSGINAGDISVILTDRRGGELFSDALAALGVDVGERVRDGSLIFVTEIADQSLELLARTVAERVRGRACFVRCINDTSWMNDSQGTPDKYLHFEVKVHMWLRRHPSVMVCQYDLSLSESLYLSRVAANHEFTFVSSTVEKQPTNRPRGQIIFDSIGEQLRALTQLQRLSLKLTASLALNETLDAIINAAVVICRADRAAVSYLDSSGTLRILRHRGLSEDYVKQRQLSRLDPALAKLIESRRPVVIEDIDELEGVSPNHGAWKREGVRSIVTLPLVSEGEVFGVIGAGCLTMRRYSESDLGAMAILAAQAGAAIINSRLFDELNKANQAKDEFLSTLSHELRTPLTPLLGWMYLLKPFAGSDPVLAQGLATVERNANQLSRLIEDLLDLTRISSGKIELVREPADVAAIVESTVVQMRPQADARRIALSLSLPDEPVASDVDRVRIQQVLSNLLGNALKFTAEGGQVSVTVRRDPDHKGSGGPDEVVIEVTDTGIGIAPEFLPHVFDKFAQAQGGINRRHSGLGLGLAIARTMVEMHGGELTAASDGLERGSRFTVRLPVAAGGADGAAHPFYSQIHEDEIEPLGLRVVLIEDSHDTIDMLKLWLSAFGCDVMMATDAREGIRLASEHRPDLIISDIGMPEVDGYELIRQMRCLPGLERVPAIALTGYARDEDRELAITAGYNAHLAKPAEMGRLFHLMKKLTAGGSQQEVEEDQR